MKANQNIGNWSAAVDNTGKTPQIVINGTFPTFGQKPLYHLEKKDPPGIVDTELVLTLIFGTLANTEGSVFFSVERSYPIEHTDKYKTVLVVDQNERTIANITVTAVNDKIVGESVDLQPYLEVIKGIEIFRNSLKIRVPSNGLTSKESFKINIIKGFTGQPPFLLEIIRTQPDYGKAFLPEGIVIEYSPEELDEEFFSTYKLANQIG